MLAASMAVAAALASPDRPSAQPAGATELTVSSTTPATTTTTAPTTTQPPAISTTTTRPAKTRLVINGAGDTNLDPNYIPTFQSEGYEHAFSGLDRIFLDDDLTVVNLECAASEIGAPAEKAFNFNCDINALGVLRDAGVEVANLANNHGGDYGRKALLDTKVNVAAAGVAPVGVGNNAAQAHEPALFERNGWTIAVLGFNGVIPAADWIATDDDPGMADGDTIATMVAAVEAADSLADLVFVTIHWGVELDLQPRPEDVERARAMIDAGADGIFGHHPHRLQPLEVYNGKPIAWSLGNFVWPRLSEAGATSAIAQFVVEPDGTIEACLIPVVIESHGHPVVQVDYRGPCQWSDNDPVGTGSAAR
jgi:poly-gamma-glutamate synthesis protein (capsule biosynthesis protein)